MATSISTPADVSEASRKIKTSSSRVSEDSQTAADFISDQLQLEADAREALPYAFDTCTQPLGPLRQILFACLTCNPPPSKPSEPFIPAGVCYSCSISCHGEHNLVELFNKRDFVCDCGTTRLPATSPCTLRISAVTGRKGGVRSETPAIGNRYNKNFHNRFCGCEIEYDAEYQKGTMFQCLGLGSVEDGGCGEDWWHPACVVGLGPDWHTIAAKDESEGVDQGAAAVDPVKTQLEQKESLNDQVANPPGGHRSLDSPNVDTNDNEAVAHADDNDEEQMPPGFPKEDDFEHFICHKCVEAFPWIKRYANTEGFLPPVFREQRSNPPSTAKAKFTTTVTSVNSDEDATSQKRKADGSDASPHVLPILKKSRSDAPSSPTLTTTDLSQQPADVSQSSLLAPSCLYDNLPSAPTRMMSLFLKEDFRTYLCRCPIHYPLISPHSQLLEEETPYEPPLSVSDPGEGPGSSVGTGSILDRGERALSNVDRVRAIEGVMVYNHLKEKVKAFLQPFAEEGRTVGAEDIKKYFEGLRGDTEGVQKASEDAKAEKKGNAGRERDNGGGDGERKAQSGH